MGWTRTIHTLVVSALLVVKAFAQTDPCLWLTADFNASSNSVALYFGGEAAVAYTLETSVDFLNWSPIWTNIGPANAHPIYCAADSGQTFYRVSRSPLPIFGYALTAKSNVVLQGNNIFVDSYDSLDPSHSTNGLYYGPLRKAGGDIAVLGGVDAQNAVINGKVHVGPTGNFAIGASGSIGDLDWIGPGIEPGWFLNDFNYCQPDVAPPFSSGFPITGGGAGTNNYILGSASYYFTGDFSLLANQTLYVAGNARLYVTGNFRMVSLTSSYITIASGASLKLYVGTTAGIGVSGTLTRINNFGNAFTFQYYGLASNTNVSWTITPSGIGVICAPQATLSLNGNSPTNDLQGALVAQSIKVNGYVQFHFDENLKRHGPTR